MRTTRGNSTAAEPNRRKFRLWNSHGHVTTLPMAMAIPDAEISAVHSTLYDIHEQNKQDILILLDTVGGI